MPKLSIKWSLLLWSDWGIKRKSSQYSELMVPRCSRLEYNCSYRENEIHIHRRFALWPDQRQGVVAVFWRAG